MKSLFSVLKGGTQTLNSAVSKGVVSAGYIGAPVKLEDAQEVAEVLHFSSNYDVTTFLRFGRALVYPFSDF